MEILTAAINVIWLYLCLAPALLALAIILIKWAKNSDASLQNNQKSHKHKYRLDSSKSSVTHIPGTPDTGVIYAYVCDDCGNEYEDRFIG